MANGYADVLVGLQYGDEGKGRVIDLLAAQGEYGVIARYNGGANAGHVLEVNTASGLKRIALHQVPSGIFHQNMMLYIGSGCVVNPVALQKEVANIRDVDVSLDGRLHISSLAALVQPHHILLDSLTGGGIGTTGQGIGPAYADRARRAQGNMVLHLRTGDLLADPDETLKLVRSNLNFVIATHKIHDVDRRKLMDEFSAAATAMLQYIQPDTQFMIKLARRGVNTLFEGAQSYGLDVVYGQVPYVTSSHTLAGAANVGGDLPPNYQRHTYGVIKAIMSRVGWGPFVSEFGGARSEQYCMKDMANINAKVFEAKQDVRALLASDAPFDVGQGLRILGNEYGATTGRPRRIGSLDLVQARQAVLANGVDALFITKGDCLADFGGTRAGTIPLVTGYRLDGKPIDYVPAALAVCKRIEPAVKHLPCFDRGNIANARTAEDLPQALRAFISHVEANTNCPVRGVGVGPQREQFVFLNG